MIDYFISDLHFEHRNILKYCGRLGLSKEEQSLYDTRQNFKVSEESVWRMNELIVSDTNSTVGEKDRLWILGDFCYPHRDIRKNNRLYVDRVEYWRYRFACENVFLIWGNHDSTSWREDDPKRRLIRERGIFNGTYDLKTIQIEDQIIVLCHYAMATWEQMNCKWGPPFWNLYGHSHTTAENGLDAAFPGRMSMDVGVDNIFRLFGNYCPLSFHQIKEIMSKRTGHRIDHHATTKNEKWLGKDHSASEDEAQ